MYRNVLSSLLSVCFLTFPSVSFAQALATQPPGAASATDAAAQPQKNAQEILKLVDQYCGVCHSVPGPNILPKRSWPKVIQAMADLATERMGKNFIPAEHLRDITALYYGSSPETLNPLPYSPASDLRFQKKALPQQTKVPLVVNIKPVSLLDNEDPQFLVCDGDKNSVSLLSYKEKKWQETKLADIDIPSHTEVVDFDQDGKKDVLVAALGLYPPSEILSGEIILLRQVSPGKFEKIVLLEKVGRITDARALDIDGDNDLDIAVAIFGGGTIGRLAWLESIGGGKFKKHTLLQVSGGLNISPIDLNNDGKIDFVSALSQEFEMIVGLINNGDKTFTQKLITQAPHPMFGMTSAKVVDLDKDGDEDILLTNGDAYDTQTDPKPYHGVQWIENKGNMNFQYRNIARYYGAATAEAADIDNDGDLDIIAGSWNNYWEDPKRQSLVLFENNGKQEFSQKGLLNAPKGIVSVAVQDITGNGKKDILAGVFRIDLLLSQLGTPVERIKNMDDKSTMKDRFILIEQDAPHAKHN